MVVGRIASYAKATAETLRGAAVVLVSPNAPIPATKLHPRMPPRPFTSAEWVCLLKQFKVRISNFD